MPQASVPLADEVHERRLHPTRIGTPAAAARRSRPGGRGGCTGANPSRPDAHSFPRSRPFKLAGSSRERDVPLVPCSGAGQTPIDSVPGGFGRRGRRCEWYLGVTSRIQWLALAVPLLGLAARPRARFPLPPSSDSTGACQERSHGLAPPSPSWVLRFFGGVAFAERTHSSRTRREDRRPIKLTGGPRCDPAYPGRTCE
jgi:hypothetical protein